MRTALLLRHLPRTVALALAIAGVASAAAPSAPHPAAAPHTHSAPAPRVEARSPRENTPETRDRESTRKGPAPERSERRLVRSAELRSEPGLRRDIDRTPRREARVETKVEKTEPKTEAKREQVEAPKAQALERAPKLVVYDWDGTLGDTYPQLRYIVTNAARDAGLPELKSKGGEDPYRAVIDGASLEVMFRRLAPNGSHAQETKFVERFKEHTASAPPELVKLKPGVFEELHALREKHPDIKLAILSSRPQDVVEGLARKAGITSMFSKIVGTGGSKIAEKPSPEGLMLISKALGVEPKESVMVGDTPMDVGAGKAAGMHTVALLDGMGTSGKLAEARPDYTLDRLPGFVDGVLPAPAAAKTGAATKTATAH